MTQKILFFVVFTGFFLFCFSAFLRRTSFFYEAYAIHFPVSSPPEVSFLPSSSPPVSPSAFSFLLKKNKKDSTKKSKTPIIQVGEAQRKKSRLALFPFSCKTKEKSPPAFAKKIEDKLSQTVLNNLSLSNLFELLSEKKIKKLQKNFPTLLSSPQNFPFSKWKAQNIEFFIQGECEIQSKNQIELKAYLHSLLDQKALVAKMYSSSLHFVRDLGHSFSNDVVLALTKRTSFFQTKILTSRWGRGNRKKEIFLLDWDGKNPKQITNHQSLSISPAWSWNGKQIAYTSFLFHTKFKTRNADLILYDIKTKKGRLLSSRKGMNSGATFHPNGESVFFTSSIKGSPDIFQIFLKNNKLQQITNGPFKAMNVEPSISPDGERMAFSSDRSGRPTIYIMNLITKKTTRLISIGKYNASPVWSPDGKSLAFAGYDKKHFDIFVVKADGTGLIRLTSSKKSNGNWANNEDPSFSPDGRRILFTSDRSENKQLYIIKPDGTDERRITFDNYHYERPKWSPFLK